MAEAAYQIECLATMHGAAELRVRVAPGAGVRHVAVKLELENVTLRQTLNCVAEVAHARLMYLGDEVVICDPPWLDEPLDTPANK